MADPIVEELALDIAPALASVSTIDDALGQLVTNFGSGLTDALSGVASAFTATPVTVDVNADTTNAADVIATLGSQPVDVAVDADTTNAADLIALLDSIPVAVEVNADTTTAAGEIDALAATPIDIPVTVDTTDAQNAIDDLGSSASGATGGVDSLSGGVEALKGVTGLAGGQIDALAGSVSNIGPASAAAVSGIGAVVGVAAVAVNTAADASAQNQRFADTFGVLADRVRQVDVGGLNISLDDLGRRTGTLNADLEATASRLGALGKSAGASDATIVSTTQNILALGANASVTNPRLGDTADVSDRLATAFIRGGRALAPYGISLSKAQIETAALAETGKTAASQLTTYERITAGATLATQQFGDSLGTSFDRGAQNAQVKLRAIKEEVTSTLIAIGTPILGPSVEVLRSFVPIAEQAANVIGALAKVALPLLTSLGPILIPVAGGLNLVADGLGLIASGLDNVPPAVLFAVAGGLIAIAAATGVLDGAIATLSAFVESNGPLLLLVGAFAALGAITHLFSGEASATATEAKNIGDALFSAAGSTRAFKAGIDSAEAGLLKFLEDENAANKIRNLDRVLNDTGITLAQVARAVSGSATEFEQLKTAAIEPLIQKLPEADQAVARLGENALREFLSAKGGAGQLTEAEANLLGAIENTNSSLNGQRDAFIQTSQAQLESLLHSGQITQAEFDQAEATAHATSGVQGYGAALDFINNVLQINAERARDVKIATIDTSGEFQKLRLELATGATTAAEAQTALVNLGLSADDAKTFVKGAVDAVQQLVTSITSQLPDAGTAIGQFSTDLKTAFDAVAREASSTSGIDSASKNLDAANQRLADVERRAVGPTKSAAASHAQAIRDAQRAVSSAEQGVIDAKNQDAAGLAKSQQALLDAADPTKFIVQLFAQAANARTFLANLTKLSDEGFNALALNLAQKGPEAAGALADGLAKNEGKAKFAEAGIQAEATVEQNFIGLIKNKLAPAVLGPAGEVGNNLGTGVNFGFALGFDIGKAIAPTDADKQHALHAGSEIGVAFSQGVAFGMNTGRVIDDAAKTQADEAQAALRKHSGSFSPARAFIPIGQDWAAGVALGLRDARPIDDASRALVASVPIAFAGLTPSRSLVANTGPSSAVGVPSAVDLTELVAAVRALKDAATPKTVGPLVFNEKVDPLHVANDIAWRVQGAG